MMAAKKRVHQLKNIVVRISRLIAPYLKTILVPNWSISILVIPVKLRVMIVTHLTLILSSNYNLKNTMKMFFCKTMIVKK